MARRKVKPERVIVVGLSALLIIALAGFGLYGLARGFSSQESQITLHARARELKDKRDRTLEEINASKKPEDLTQASFDSLKDLALHYGEFPVTDAYDPSSEITTEEVEQMNAEDQNADERAVNLLLHLNQYSQKDIDFFLEDPDRYEFVLQAPQKDALSHNSVSLEESLETVPQLLQWDPRWGYIAYGDSTLAENGSGPAALSMVLSYLKKDPSLTPAAIATWSENNGYYISHLGTAHSLFNDAPEHYGVHMEGVRVTETSVEDALKEGYLLVFSMVPGDYEKNGGFIVVTGMEDGKYKVLDPNSLSHSTSLQDPETVLNETSAIWGYKE